MAWPRQTLLAPAFCKESQTPDVTDCIIATLAPFQSVNLELPTVRLDTCKKQCISIVNSVLESSKIMCIDGVLCYVRDICPFPYATNNLVEDDIPTSSDDEMYITVSNSRDEDDHLVDSDLGSSSDSNDNEGQQLTMGPSQSREETTALCLQWSNRWKAYPTDATCIMMMVSEGV